MSFVIRRADFYDFDERYDWAEGVADSDDIRGIIQNKLPNCVRVERAGRMADKQGTDYWACRPDGSQLSIDVKIRATDYAVGPFPKDDLALETWSVLPENGRAGKLGWTRDPNKRTDFIMWYWEDTHRYCWVPFTPLCAVFSEHWEEWAETYGRWQQRSTGWSSECVFVPRAVLRQAINDWCDGDTQDGRRCRRRGYGESLARSGS